MGTRKKVALTDAEKRYEDIVNIAGELFASKGFAGTSLNDIADAVGVLKGSLYHYISSKESLLFDVIKVSHQGLQDVVRTADPFANNPIDHLAAFCFAHISLNATEERIHRGIVFLQDSRFLVAKKWAEVQKDRDAYTSYLRAIIVAGQKAKVFDAELDPKLSSFNIIGVLTSYIRWYRPGGAITAADLARDASAFVLASILTIETRASLRPRFAAVDAVIARLGKKT